MSDDQREAYVNRIREQSRDYTRELLRENRDLKLAIATLEGERDRAVERARHADAVSRENRDLRARLEAAEHDVARFRRRADEAEAALAKHQEERHAFEQRLEVIENEGRRHLDEYMQLEQQNTNLANLYVASYRLHSTLDPDDVVSAIAEIIVNLVGSEEFAIFNVDREAGALRLQYGFGVDSDALEALPLATAGIGEHLASGDIYLRNVPAHDDSALNACIPLKFGDEVTGAIVVYRLLPHKNDLGDLDRELFALLGTHAASALYSARLHVAARAEGAPA